MMKNLRIIYQDGVKEVLKRFKDPEKLLLKTEEVK